MKFSHILTSTVSALSLGLTVEGHFLRSRNDAVGPKQPFKPLPYSHPRKKVCHVRTHGDGSDDSKFILSALNQCNHGGKAVFEADKEYTIGTALDLTFLKHIDLGTPPILSI